MNRHNSELNNLLTYALKIPKIVWDVGVGWVMVAFDGYMLAMTEREAKKRKYLDFRRRDDEVQDS